MIEWKPIIELPDEFKDGRQVLLWDYAGAQVATWDYGGWYTGFGSEIDSDPIMVEFPSHFVEISRPPETMPNEIMSGETP